MASDNNVTNVTTANLTGTGVEAASLAQTEVKAAGVAQGTFQFAPLHYQINAAVLSSDIGANAIDFSGRVALVSISKNTFYSQGFYVTAKKNQCTLDFTSDHLNYTCYDRTRNCTIGESDILNYKSLDKTRNYLVNGNDFSEYISTEQNFSFKEFSSSVRKLEYTRFFADFIIGPQAQFRQIKNPKFSFVTYDETEDHNRTHSRYIKNPFLPREGGQAKEKGQLSGEEIEMIKCQEGTDIFYTKDFTTYYTLKDGVFTEESIDYFPAPIKKEALSELKEFQEQLREHASSIGKNKEINAGNSDPLIKKIEASIERASGFGGRNEDFLDLSKNIKELYNNYGHGIRHLSNNGWSTQSQPYTDDIFKGGDCYNYAAEMFPSYLQKYTLYPEIYCPPVSIGDKETVHIGNRANICMGNDTRVNKSAVWTTRGNFKLEHLGDPEQSANESMTAPILSLMSLISRSHILIQAAKAGVETQGPTIDLTAEDNTATVQASTVVIGSGLETKVFEKEMREFVKDTKGYDLGAPGSKYNSINIHDESPYLKKFNKRLITENLELNGRTVGLNAETLNFKTENTFLNGQQIYLG